MNLQQIKDAVDQGKTVCWKNHGYTVEYHRGIYSIVWMAGTAQENCIGLTWEDGKTMNGEETDFYIYGK